MRYESTAIPDAQVPRARDPIFQHALDTYASESNKVVSVWGEFKDADLPFRPHEKSSTVLEIMKHQLLSERRFFGEFLGVPEPAPGAVLPTEMSVAELRAAMVRLALPRLAFLAERDSAWCWQRCHSSMWSGSGCGCSGGACCTLRITGHS